MEQDSSLSTFFRSGFIKQEGITAIYRREKLFSRKNDVYRIEVGSGTGIRQYVFKRYRGREKRSRIKNELFFYNLLGSNGLRAPKIYYSDKEVIVMEYMGNRTLLDYIIEEEDSARSKGISIDNDYTQRVPLLIETLGYIHYFNKNLGSLTGRSYVLNDMNHRNFLLPGKQVCRVDLEDCREGAVEEDIGKFVAFFLTYNPAFTEWKRSVSEYMKSYCRDTMDANISTIDGEIKKELERMAERRK